MLNTKTTILLGGAALIAYNYLAKGSALKNVNFLPGTVKGLVMDGSTPILTVTLLAQNTSNQQMVVHSIAGNITCNKYLVGSFSNFTPQVIYPNNQAVLSIDIRFGLLGIVSDIVNAWTGSSFSQIIEMKGMVNVDNVQLPLTGIKYKVG